MPDMEREKWVAPYRAAMLELDRGKLLNRINEARKAIQERILQLQDRPSHEEERQAIEDALQNLRVLAKIEP